jgi:small neutral amino acid transporter SnatA (MarC family)
MTELVAATVLLILVTDPFGNVPLAVAALRNVPRERRTRVVLRECLIAYGLLLAFLFGGRSFLALMQLSEASLSIAGGVILFLIALRMVFSHPEGVFGDAARGEPFVVPLAIPAIAGPSALATVMLLASRHPASLATLVAALSIAMVVMLVVLLASGARAARRRRARRRRDGAADGLVLTALAVEMLLSGLRTFVAQLPR